MIIIFFFAGGGLAHFHPLAPLNLFSSILQALAIRTQSDSVIDLAESGGDKRQAWGGSSVKVY